MTISAEDAKVVWMLVTEPPIRDVVNVKRPGVVAAELAAPASADEGRLAPLRPLRGTEILVVVHAAGLE
ncbi:MAG: hypothetical protein ACYC9L_05705 [Sulfuricaulis sp.]